MSQYRLSIVNYSARTRKSFAFFMRSTQIMLTSYTSIEH